MAHGPFMFNACQDLVHCCLGFPQYKGVTFFAQCLTSSLDIQKLKSKNKQGIPHVLVWLKVIIKKTIKHQNTPYNVKPTHDHQTLNVSSNLIRLQRHKNLRNLFVVLLQVACPSLLSTQCANWAYFSRFKSQVELYFQNFKNVNFYKNPN